MDSVESGLEVILVIIQHDKYSLHFCLFPENLQKDELKGEFVSGENYKAAKCLDDSTGITGCI